MSRDLDKMVAKMMEELDVEALLDKPTEFIKEDECSKILLYNLLNDDDLLNEYKDDLAIVATIRIIPLNFVDQASDLWYLEGDVMVKEAEYIALVQEELEEIRFKKK